MTRPHRAGRAQLRAAVFDIAAESTPAEDLEWFCGHGWPPVGRGGRAKSFTGMRVIVEAVDGIEAVARYIEHRPVVALIDLKMSGLDGVGAVMGVPCELAAGTSNKEIGAALGVAEGTMKVHAARVYERLGASGRTEALALALELGIIRLPGRG